MILPRSSSGPDHQVDVYISLVDDSIVEAQQTFVGYIEVVDAVDTDTITLGRTAAMLIINDDDGS